MRARDWQRLADEIRTARLRKGYGRQQDLAEAAGVSLRTVSNLESRHPDPVKPWILAKIELALDWAPGSAEAVLAGGRPTTLPARRDSSVEAEMERRLSEAERQIVQATNAELGEMLIEVMSVPTMTRAAVARWLVDALDMRDEWRTARDERARGYGA